MFLIRWLGFAACLVMGNHPVLKENHKYKGCSSDITRDSREITMEDVCRTGNCL